MNEQVRQAAERLRKIHDGISCKEVYGSDYDNTRNHPYVVDMRSFLGYALSTVPADDGEAVDKKWLSDYFPLNLSFGFAVAGHSVSIWNSKQGWSAYAVDVNDYGEMVQIGFCKLKTRGDVRRLCSALGIDLKEQKEGAK